MMKPPPFRPGRARSVGIAILFLLAAGIATIGGFYYTNNRAESLKDAEGRLSVIAELKVNQIVRWRQERMANANYLRNTPYIARRAVDVLKQPTSGSTRATLIASVQPFITDGAFESVLLLDGRLTARVTHPAKAARDLSGVTRSAAEQALNSHKVVVTDLYRETDGGPVYLSFAVPIVVRQEGDKENVPAAGMDASPADRGLGVLILQANADKSFFPEMQTWPSPSPTGELILARREGDEVVYLNALRHRPDAALKMRLPLTNSALPAVNGVLGKRGVFEGRDYNGAPVLAAVKPVPDTPWVLVAQMDENEASADAQSDAWSLGLTLVSLILLVGAATAYFYRQRQARKFRGLYESERQQREAEAAYRTTLYSLGDAVITTDNEGRVRDMNPVAEKLTGWSEQEARGRPLEEIFRILNENTRAPVASPAQEVLREAKVVGLANQTLLLARDGTARPIADSAAPIRDQDGRVTGVVLVFNDQSERHAARQALRESEEKLRQIVEHSTQLFYSHTADHRLTYVSPQTTTFFDCSPAEALRQWTDFVTDNPINAEGYGLTCKAIETGQPQRPYQLELKTAQGRILWVEVHESPVVVDGKTVAIVGSLTDITERKLADERLRESEDRYRSLVEESPEAIGIFQDDELVFVNSKCAQLLGAKTQEELLGRKSEQVIHPEERSTALDRIRRRLAGELGIYPVEVRYLRVDGTTVPVEVSASPVTFAGKPAVQFIARGIAARKQAEQALRDSEALYHSLVEHLPQQIFRKDLAGRFTFANSSFCRMMGKPLAQILGKTDFEIFPAELATKFHQDDQRVIQTGQSLEMEEQNRDADGKTLFLSVIKTPLRDGAGRIIGVQGISWDVTARRQAEATLKMLERATEQSPASIVITNAHGSIEYVNQKFVAVSGYSREEALGKNPRILKSGEMSTEAYRRMWETLLEGQEWRGEFHNRKKDGTLYWESASISPIKDSAGKITHFVAVKEDVTEGKRAASKLAEQAILIDKANDAIFVRELDDTIGFWNKGAERLYGWTAAEVLGRNANELLYHAANPPQVEQARRITIEQGTWRGELNKFSKSGAPVVVNSSWTLARDVAGKPREILVISHDITERKRAEVIRATLLSLATSLGGTNTPGEVAKGIFGAADQLWRWDAATLEVCVPGTDQTELVACVDIVEGERRNVRLKGSPSKGSARARRILTQGAELMLRTPPFAPLSDAHMVGDTSHLSASIMAVPIRRKGEALGILSIQSYTPNAFTEDDLRVLQGLADHCGGALDRIRAEESARQAQEQLRQSQKLEAIGQLAGGVAHDFNNMLAVIRGNAELVLMNDEELSGPTSEGLKQINAAADRAANLTRHLLAFSRKQVMQFQQADLNDVIAHLTKMLNRIIGEHVELQCLYAKRLPAVKADVGMLEQVLMNLAVNARDAMPTGGQMVIGTTKVELSESEAREHPEGRAGEFVCLSVSDTGTGIQPEHLAQIFEPFFTTKEPGKGTGLGLATVYGIVKQHNGWVQVATQVGEGSTFRIFLPAIAPSAETAAAEAEPPPRGGNETILVVEDEQAVRLLTRRVLESFGYRVEEAASGREALEIWSQRGAEIDLLLTDMVMPGGVMGRELAERLQCKKSGLKVIFISGYSTAVAGKDTDFIRRTKSHYLQKPCPTRLLIQTVRECLDEK